MGVAPVPVPGCGILLVVKQNQKIRFQQPFAQGLGNFAFEKISTIIAIETFCAYQSVRDYKLSKEVVKL